MHLNLDKILPPKSFDTGYEQNLLVYFSTCTFNSICRMSECVLFKENTREYISSPKPLKQCLGTNHPIAPLSRRHESTASVWVTNLLSVPTKMTFFLQLRIGFELLFIRDRKNIRNNHQART